jgi:hypothetical protein
MNRHVASAFAYVSTVAAATVAAALMATSAFAEGPILQDTPFVSTRTRADVQAELMSQAEQVRTGSTEWAMQLNQPVKLHSGYTTEQARSEYKAARDVVHAMTSEDSGSSYLASMPARTKSIAVMAGTAR